VGTNLWKEWSGRVRRQLEQGKDRVLTAQAEELRDLYGRVLRPGALQALEEFLSARSPAGARLCYAMVGGAHRQRLVDEVVYRSLYLLRRL